MNIETNAVHGGERQNRRQNRSVTTPIEQTAAYYFENTGQVIDFYEGRLPGIKYGRYGCPTQHAAEAKLSELEGAERSLLFSSGMGALTTTVLALTGKNQDVVFADDCYRNTRRFFLEVLPRFGIESTAVPIEEMGHVEDYLKENTTMLFCEVPTNPFLRVIDVRRATDAARKRGVTSFIDSTFATPINLRPMELGADLVMHSATKYLGGHNDLFAGTVSGGTDPIGKVQGYRDVLGGIIDPHTSYLLLRSLQTLPIRMEAHNKNGLKIAEYLQKHPKIERVWYPGCESHPDYALAKEQMSGFGGVVTFSLKATEQETSHFVDSLELPYLSTNFGGPQSLIEQHAIQTYYKDRKEADRRGIAGNVLRYSVGFENPEDVIGDFEAAFGRLH